MSSAPLTDYDDESANVDNSGEGVAVLSSSVDASSTSVGRAFVLSVETVEFASPSSMQAPSSSVQAGPATQPQNTRGSGDLLQPLAESDQVDTRESPESVSGEAVIRASATDTSGDAVRERHQESHRISSSETEPATLQTSTMVPDSPTPETKPIEPRKQWCRRRPRCTYPNGLLTVLAAQGFLLLSNIMGLNSFWGCDLVMVTGDLEAIFLGRSVTLATNMSAVDYISSTDDINATSSNSTATTMNATNTSAFYQSSNVSRGMGLWSWQNEDGMCVRSDKDMDEKYADIAYNDLYKRFRETTSSWNFMRTTATTAIYVAWLLTLWLLVFSCIPFSVRMRNVLGLLLIVALSTSQAPVLNVKYTDFCKVHGCQAGESWDFSIAAMTLVTIAGVMLILSNNDRRREQQRLRNLALNGAAASRDGLNIAEEVPVESGLIDLSLIDPAAAAAAAEVEGGR